MMIAVFDGSRALDSDDIALLEQIGDKPCVAVVNKNDKGILIDKQYIESKIQHTVYISAASGDGIDALEKAILQVTELDKLNTSAGIIINERQISCAMCAYDAVREALDAVLSGMTFDAVNVSICDAIDCLLELSGDRVTDRVVDEVFSHFCVGK